MKKLLFNIAALLFSSCLLSQSLTNSGEGANSILFKGASISFDLGKTDLSFDANNVNDAVGENKKFICGLGLSGKNEEGLANWFSKGDVVPETKLNGMLGYSFSNGTFPQVEARRRELFKKSERIDKRAEIMYYKDMPYVVRNKTKKPEQKELREELLKALSDKTPLIDFKKLVADKEDDKNEVKEAKKAIGEEIQKIEKFVTGKTEEINKQLNKVSEEVATTPYRQFMVFGIGGINALSFKKFNTLDTVDFNKTFATENFHGGNVGIGANLQIGSLIFGANYLYVYGNSFDQLDKKEYTIKTVNTNSIQSMSSEKKVTGYSGEYSVVEINKFTFDVVYNCLLQKESTNHLLINPYYRATTHSNKSKLIPHTMDVGLGLYFFNDANKFIGGIYAELPDLENKIERLKPETEQNLKSPFKRGTLGLVTKFSISSVLNLF